MALADRIASESGRALSGRERDTGLVDRVAAVADRTAAAHGRALSALDRSAAADDRATLLVDLRSNTDRKTAEAIPAQSLHQFQDLADDVDDEPPTGPHH